MNLFYKQVRVRSAPSPTGFLHIGNFRTILYNYLFAKKHKGIFILRIEDTDQARSVEGGVENIIKTLKWAGLEFDEGPYIQSERLEIYKKYAEQLVEQGSAYCCDCTAERLTKLREEQTVAKQPTMYDGHCRPSLRDGVPSLSDGSPSRVIRLKVPKEGSTVFDDEVRGHVEFENKLIDDAVLLKSDGFPTYHLANVVDDHLMKITHVIRGEEWISSTPKHILLYKAFGWKPPVFAHLPLLLNADHSKLSKRQGDVAVEDYIKKGYLRDALINFVALLAWNPRADQEIYDLKTLIKEFDLKKVNKSGAVVNFEKLDWLNGNYIRQLSVDELTKLCQPYIKEPVDADYLKKIVGLEQERLKKLSDITEAAEMFLMDQPEYAPELLVWKKMQKEDAVKNLIALHSLLREISFVSQDDLETKIKAWITQNNLKTGEVLWPMRVALSGRSASPSPFEIASILGKEKTLKRIEYAIKIAQKL